MPGRIEAAFPGDSLGRFQNITERARDGINTYIVVKTGVSIGTGTCAGLICLIFGIELWFVWAVGAIVLNYEPYIGSLIASVPPALLGMLMMNDDPFSLLLFLGLLVANQQFWGSLIETKWAGEALDLSPVLLLIVVAFSYWLWGIVGMVISVPFTVIIKIILDTVEQTRPLAVLMSERSPDLQKVWNDALRDGRLDDWEFTRLLELQRNLDVDEMYSQWVFRITDDSGDSVPMLQLAPQQSEEVHLSIDPPDEVEMGSHTLYLRVMEDSSDCLLYTSDAADE